MKRMDYINWDEYFMGIALLTAMRSKDPNSQVGACIVSSENKILSLGYNGMPIGCSDDEMPWEREGAPLDTKYMYVCHAELNAILNSAWSIAACRLSTPDVMRKASKPIWRAMVWVTMSHTTIRYPPCRRRSSVCFTSSALFTVRMSRS